MRADGKSPMLTPEQLQILQHALGVDKFGRGPMYRNHFCAGAGDEPICRELVQLGLMETFERKWLPYYNCTVTEAGKRAMLRNSPKPPKLSRSEKRYREWLRVGDLISFGDWLRRKTDA